jgi:hypothetical protein
MAGKELETAEYYDWKGLPQSSLVAYRGILNHTSCCRGFRTRDLPETEAARKARARVKEMTMPGRQDAVPEETEP